jgi:ATP-dependent Clp protease protease subunit
MKLSSKPHFHNGRVDPGKREWFSLKKDAQEILIYDEIGRGFFGGGVSAEDFVEEVQGLNLSSGDSLRVRLNSPGGDLWDGNTIYNYLRSQPFNVNMHIDGVAASAASIVAMAGDTVSMPENSFLMIHNPWMFAAGDANTFRKVADDLDRVREGAVNTYASRTNLPRDELIQMLDDETWIGANQAVEMGFADEVTDAVQVAAMLKFDYESYGFHTPQALTEQERKEQENLKQMRADWSKRNSAARR